MAYDFDKILSEPLAPTPAAPPPLPAAPTSAPQSYDFNTILDEPLPNAEATKKAALFEASFRNPDEEAKKKNLSDSIKRFTGERIPPAVVDIAESERQFRHYEADHATRASPRTSAFFSVQENANIAMEDAKTLASIEKAWSTPVRILGKRSMSELGGDTARGLAVSAIGLGEAAVGIADLATFNAVGNVLGALGYDPKGVQEFVRSYDSLEKQAADAAVHSAKGFGGTLQAAYDNPMSALGTIVESSLLSVTGAAAVRAYATKALSAAGIAAKTPEATALLTSPAMVAKLIGVSAGAEGLMTAGSIQEQARQAGRAWYQSVLPALAGGIITGGVAAFTSRIPGFKDAEVSAALAGLGGAEARMPLLAFGRDLAKTMFKEGVLEELPQSAQEQVWTNIALGQKWDEGVAEAAALGMVAGIGQGGGMHLYSGARNGVALVVEAAAQNDVSRVEATAQRVAEVFALAAEAKITTRSPETLKAFFQSVAPDTSVLIDPAKLTEVLAANNIDIASALPTAAEQMAKGEIAGPGIEIPIGELVTGLTGTGAEAEIVKHIRMDPNSSTLAETQAEAASGRAAEFFQQEAERVLTEQAANESFLAEVKAIEDNTLTQLNTAGRTSPTVNKGQALLASKMYAVLASRMGISPQAVFAKYPIRIGNETMGGAVLDQVDQPATTETFTKAGISTLLDRGKWAILTAENPGAQSLSPEENAARNAELVKYMAEIGVSFTPVKGQYGRAENSFVVTDITPQQALDIGRKFDQESVLTRHGYVYQDGTVTKATGLTVHDTPPEDYYTTLPDGTTFTVDLDFDNERSARLDDVLAQKGKKKKAPKAIAPGTESALTDAASIANANAIAATGKFDYIRDLKEQIQNAVRAAAQGADLSAMTAEVRKYLVDLGTQEALAALQSNANAIGWYDEKTQQALSVVSLIHPEILTDPDARFTFIYALAVTSNGQRVSKNFELAERAYSQWKSTGGTMPSNVGAGGPAGAKVHEALGRYNDLVKKFGSPAAVEEFMLTEFTSKELTAAGFRKSGENVDTVVLGAAILGPKIGNGFFANLYGIFDRLTMDRWLMRTWGRWTGTLLQDNQAEVADEAKVLKLLVRGVRADKESNAAMRQVFAMSVKGDVDKALLKAGASPWEALVKTGDVGHIADQLRLKSTYPALRAVMQSTPMLDELRKSGNRLYNKMDGSNEAPGGGNQRNWIRAVFGDILKSVTDITGKPMTMADLQSLLWFPEKRLYDSAKADVELEGYEDDEAPDYANAAVALARSKGIAEDRITSALANPADRPATVRPVAGGTVARELGSFTDESGGTFAQSQRTVPDASTRDAAAVSGPVAGAHYSQQPRTTIVSSAFGTGAKGAERTRIAESTDPRIKQRIAFYVNTGNGITPEQGVGAVAHTATLTNLYDADADAMKIFRNAGSDTSFAESAVLDAGFDGYLTREFGTQGAAVLLGSRAVQVQQGDAAKAPVAPSANIPAMKAAAMRLAQDRSLPSGQMTAAEWQTAVERLDPALAKQIDFTQLDQSKGYYKNEIANTLWQGGQWYFSQLQTALEKAPAKVFGNGKAVAQWLTANAGKMGVKADELKWTGILDWLETQDAVTQEQVVAFMAQGGVQIREVVLGDRPVSPALKAAIAEFGKEPTTPEEWSVLSGKMMEAGQYWQGAGQDTHAEKYFELSDEAMQYVEGVNPQSGSTAGEPKFASYQLPGGENYREWLLTLPAVEDVAYKMQALQSEMDIIRRGRLPENMSAAENARFDEALADYSALKKSRDTTFRSSHFDQPNIVAHVRTNERIDADGKRVLFIEEIQSDWAQKGRKEGFQITQEERDRLNAESERLAAKYREANARHRARVLAEPDNAPYNPQDLADLAELKAIRTERQAVDDAIGAAGLRIPSAPFVTDTKAWTALALKRMIAHAAENGFDSIAWTTGEQQAARYDLSKHIDSLHYDPYNKQLSARKGDQQVLKEQGVTPEKIADYVGKDAAKKLLETELNGAGNHELKGLALQVGGEGMKGYYDKIVPSVANEILRKLGGGKVETTEIGTGDMQYQGMYEILSGSTNQSYAGPFKTHAEALAHRAGEFDKIVQIGTTEQPGFAITDKMRELVATTGMPLFAGQEGPKLGSFNPATLDLRLLADANPTTFLHELGHFFLTVYADIASQPGAPQEVVDDVNALLKWFGITGDEQGVPGGDTLAQTTPRPEVRDAEGYLLAPNGKRSKLDAQQWAQVRTPAFKAWFGDWEKHATAKTPVGSLWSDDAVSKVVDANGEPMVMYHGTRKGGFFAFRPDKADKHRSAMVFTTNDRMTARTYSGRSDEIELHVPQTQAELEAVGFDFTTDEDTGGITYTTNGYGYNGPYLTLRAALEDATNDFLSSADEQAGVYHLFLNIRNPNETDFEGLNWDGQAGYDQWSVENVDGDIEYLDGRGVLREDEAHGFLATLGGEGAGYAVVQAAGRGETTNSVAEEALEYGHDGAIIRNVTDDGGQGGYADVADVFVFFDATQAKSATQNRGTFSVSTDNLLHQGEEVPAPGPLPTGRTALEIWNSMSLDQQRPYHEQLAESWEQYLFTGRAPSIELQPLFRRFTAWMKSVYASIKEFIAGHPGAKLNPDIAAIFDRVLATQQEIEEANAARGYTALFKDAAEAGMTDKQFADYMALTDDQKEDAEALLRSRALRDMKWLRASHDKIVAALQADAKEQRAAVRAEVAAEQAATPLRRAIRWLTKGEHTSEDGTEVKATAGHKLAKADIEALFPEGALTPRPDLSKLRGMTADVGMHPDLAAEMFGFSSGEALVHELVNAPKFNDEVEALTDQRMIEQYGDLSSTEAIARAADEAIHNDARTRMVATELAALRTNIGTPAVLAKAAKEYARQIIETKTSKTLKPWAFAAGEVRAGKAALEALRKGDRDTAAAEKRTELVNHVAAKEAYAVEKEIKKIVDRFKKMSSYPDDSSAIKTRDAELVAAVRAILADFGIGERKGKTAREYLAVVQQHNPDLAAVLSDVIDSVTASAKDWRQLKVSELRDLAEEIDGIWFLAKRSKQIEIDGKLVPLVEAQNAIYARLDEIGIPDRVPGEGSAVTAAEKRGIMFDRFVGALRRVEAWVGAKDGSISGPFRTFMWNPIRDAADAYRADKVRYLKAYRDLLQGVAPTLTRRLIEAPEIGYVFGKDESGMGKAELLHAILHTGNASNKRKLLLGRGWATETTTGGVDTTMWDAFVTRMQQEGVLTKADYDFAQGTWDLLEAMKPLAQQAHRDVFGKYFAEITADKFVTPFGEYAGGYVPAVADPLIVRDADLNRLREGEEASMAFAFPTTAKGFTKGRVEYNRPLRLNLGSITQHIDKVLLFSHMTRPVNDVRRVLTGKGVAQALGRVDPQAVNTLLIPWLNRAAKQVVETPTPGREGLGRFWSVVRTRAGMAAMFANVANSVQQITGLFLAAVRVRPALLLDAMAKFAMSPAAMADHVTSKSKYMATRLENEVAAMSSQINEILLNPSIYQSAQEWTLKHGYFLQSAVDSVISPVVWLAGYNQAIEAGMSEADAVRAGDSAVRETQGSQAPEDVASFETGSAFYRMFVQFAGYFNMNANLLGTEYVKITRDMGLRKGAGRGLYVLMFGFIAPAVVGELVMQIFKGGPDDDDKDGEYLDDWLKTLFGYAPLRYATAMVPGFGQAINAGVNTLNNKPYDDRISTAPAVSMIESAVKAPLSVYKAIVAEGKPSRAIKDVATLVSMAVGVPGTAIARPVSYLADVAADRVQPTGPVDAARGIMTGTASPASKQ